MDGASCNRFLEAQRACGNKKKRAVGAAIKENILSCAEEAVANGEGITVYCRVIKMVKSTYYRWKQRGMRGELEDRKPIVKNCWWRLSEDMIEKVKYLTGLYPEISSQWVIGKLAGISGGSVGKIRKRFNSGPIAEVRQKIPQTVEWLKVHACWSLDMMWTLFKGVRLYLMVLVEEYSRLLLGWRLSVERSGSEAWKLVEEVIKSTGKLPLILKHDNEKGFLADIFQGNLINSGIVPLPSPAYYAPFNGKVERSIKEVRKFTDKVENRYDVSMEDLIYQIRRGFHVINEMLPRRIFEGKTSREIYATGEEYQSCDRVRLISRIKEETKNLEIRLWKRSDYLDNQRKIIVRSVQLSNLCEVKYGQKSQAVFTPICRI